MENDGRPSEERREFIARCGRFALVTPPAITLLLAANGRAYAGAASPAGGNGNGGGKGSHKWKKKNKNKLKKKNRGGGGRVRL